MLKDVIIYFEVLFFGKVSFEEKFGVFGLVEWVINWILLCDGLILLYINIVLIFEGGIYEIGFWVVIFKGICVYGELVNNKKVG